LQYSGDGNLRIGKTSMAIVDVALFESLSARSRNKILCRCDRCGNDVMVPKGNLFRVYKDGKTVFYKVGCEPDGFVAKYDFCVPCVRILKPSHLGMSHSDATKSKIREARALQHDRGRSPKPSEDGKMRISVSKTGSNNHQWKSDREALAKRTALRKACNNLIWNSIKRVSKEKVGRFEDVTGFSREDLINWIESQFVQGMTWENTSIDHIIPVSAFASHGIDDLRIINHLSNLRPMLRLENISKGCRYDEADLIAYLKTMSYVIPLAPKDA
jgi:hypothetical protein